MDRRSVLAIRVVAVVLMLLLGSCGSRNSDRSPTGSGTTAVASLTPTPSPTVVDLDSNGDLALGTYATTAFRPQFRFTIAQPGWYAGRPTRWFQTINVYPEHPEWYVIFLRLKEVYDPHSRHPSAVPLPRDLVTWFREHPQFRTTTPKKTVLGGMDFWRFDAEVVGPRSTCTVEVNEVPCVLIAPNPGDVSIHYLKGTRLRIYIRQVPGRSFLISIEAPVDEFDAFAPLAEDVLQSIEFLSPL